jgi:hypothetical protein
MELENTYPEITPENCEALNHCACCFKCDPQTILRDAESKAWEKLKDFVDTVGLYGFNENSKEIKEYINTLDSRTIHIMANETLKDNPFKAFDTMNQSIEKYFKSLAAHWVSYILGHRKIGW